MTPVASHDGFVSVRECINCQKFHESTMATIRSVVLDIHDKQVETDKTVAEIRGDIREIKTMLKSRAERDVEEKERLSREELLVERRASFWQQGVLAIIKALLPWIVAVGALGGTAYKTSQAPDPVVVQQIVDQALKTAGEQKP